MAKGSKIRKGSLRGFNVRTANNGYTMDHDVEPEKKKGGDGNQAMPMYEPTKPNVFADRKALISHIDQMLAQHEGGAGANDDDGDEAEMPKGKAALRGVIGGGKY